MLANIRKNMKLFSIPLWIVTASFILTIFLVWGKGSVSGPGVNDVATVNGKPISATDFYKTVDRLTSSGMNKKQAESEALRRLLLRTLLLDAAEKEGLKVSDWAVAQRIASFTVFQENGTFSEKLYKKWLKQNHLTPELFENEIRKDLLIEKLQTVVERTPYVTEKELKLFYKTAFGKRKYEYKIFKIDEKKIKVNEKEIEEFYNKNKDMFKETNTVVKGVEIPKSEKNAKELVKEAYRLAKEGKLSSFKKLPVKEIEDKKLLSEIENSTQNPGYIEKDKFYIVYSKESTSRTVPLKEVKENIIEMLKGEKAKEIALKKAENAAKAGKLDNPVKTDYLSGNELIQQTGLMDLNGEITTKIVKAKTGTLMGPFKTLTGYMVIKPVTDIKVDKYEKDKMETLKTFLLTEKKKAAFQAYVQFLQNKAKIQINPKFFPESKL
ncbi:peptidylprolyl isomerase [Desulfurobacterium atlanticum]|uniref:Peptidyl-prolyl cis-trans isomerase D n=1 Tax=Desulfurobacterium atlanticum TaxID=240169 RepID=A0A238ZF32_9BACT|nr:peptidylprolyl isomerase [Desulfurobacterium atlanticum]SNR81274.1 peptidyl-prolyl cis-trans isomerase D [Desulfurobacterium atlanticum]